MNDESKLERDLEALRALSARDVPDLRMTIETARQSRLDSGPWHWNLRRKIMALIDSARTRPAVAAVVIGALVVLVAMVVPVSYDRVVGQDVSLTFAGKGVAAQEVRGIAADLKTLLGSNGVSVEAVAEAGAPRYVLRATSSKHAGADVLRAAGEFARTLASKGYSASVHVTPHRERVTSPAVAYALEQIIRISVDGKAAAQLESEIRNRLAEAGVPDAEVSVTDRPDGGREIKLKVEREHVGDVGSAPPEPMPQVVLTRGGAPVAGGEGFAVKFLKKKIDGATTLTVEVTSNGKTATVNVPNLESRSDADVAGAITSQLKQAGIDAKVTVTAGKIEIDPVK
jgi:hypothetical protein